MLAAVTLGVLTAMVVGLLLWQWWVDALVEDGPIRRPGGAVRVLASEAKSRRGRVGQAGEGGAVSPRRAA